MATSIAFFGSVRIRIRGLYPSKKIEKGLDQKLMASFDSLSDVELGKSNNNNNNAEINAVPAAADSRLTGSNSPVLKSSSGKNRLADDAELYPEPDSPTSERHQLLSSRNSSSLELPRFGRWYSRRDVIPLRLRLRKQAQGLNIKLFLIIFFLLFGFIFSVVYIRRKLGRSCWAWKGKYGGPCSQFTMPGDEEGMRWDRRKKQEPEKEVMTPVAIPDFALEYAPFVYLHSDEVYLPCNISGHIEHTIPYLNYVKINYDPPPLTADDLSDISNDLGRRRVYLTSPEDPFSEPQWITGKGVTEPKDGRSEAKATIIVADKGLRDLDEKLGIIDDPSKGSLHHGKVVDVFYFYFYGFNLGPKVGGLRFGNHVGDWEHTMIRFLDGEPKAVFYSQHATGIAVDYAAVEKIGKRPVTYSANGTHANYPKAGTHSYTLPFHLLSDFANAGLLWDPTLNSDIFALNFSNTPLPPSNPWGPPTLNAYDDAYDLHPSTQTPSAPVSWFHFDGFWGDKQLPISDRRQFGIGGVWSWASGPKGPRWKDLGRRNMCLDKFETYGRMPAEGACKIRSSLKEWEGRG